MRLEGSQMQLDHPSIDGRDLNCDSNAELQLCTESRILIAGDNTEIHAALQGIVDGNPTESTSEYEASLNVGNTQRAINVADIISTFHSWRSVAVVQKAAEQGRPFFLAFVDLGVPPNLSGLETARRLRGIDPRIHVVICTSLTGCSIERVIDQLGSAERVHVLRYPFDVYEVRQLVISLQSEWEASGDTQPELRQQADSERDALHVLRIFESCQDELLLANDELMRQNHTLTASLGQRELELGRTRDICVHALAQLADSRDPETGEHLLRMQAFAQILAMDLAVHGPYTEQINSQFLEDLWRSSPLHDIGKVGIPDEILLKPGRLTPAEFEVMKGHAVIGAITLEKTSSMTDCGDFLVMAIEIARWHHERFDGTGYPHGLKGNLIPLSARIVSVADVFDALTSKRVYKNAIDVEQARSMIEEESGKHFDPAVVSAFFRKIQDLVDAKLAVDSGNNSDLLLRGGHYRSL